MSTLSTTSCSLLHSQTLVPKFPVQPSSPSFVNCDGHIYPTPPSVCELLRQLLDHFCIQGPCSAPAFGVSPQKFVQQFQMSPADTWRDRFLKRKGKEAVKCFEPIPSCKVSDTGSSFACNLYPWFSLDFNKDPYMPKQTLTVLLWPRGNELY